MGVGPFLATEPEFEREAFFVSTSIYPQAGRPITKRRLDFASEFRISPSFSPESSDSFFFPGEKKVADWTVHGTFILLDAWGDRFLQRGRKSLRSEEWKKVAEKVSKGSKIERTDTQCRNRLDTLKKNKLIYFKKMDVLMSPSPKQPGLSCGVDSRECVFSNPRVYLNRANGLDEVRDSPGHSDSTEDDTYDSDGLPPRRKRPGRANNPNNKNDCSPMTLLADSLHNFSKIYEKFQRSKRQQMVELEKMRMDCHRDLEQQKKILQMVEIAKIWQGGDEDNSASADNISS
uniref:Myb/SANT-like DNA-binding domain-containing protein n=1 Tax=Kalanchoe fedtschenkoi TaxID=63787 RepID=A0A7N0V099_KALFE